MFLNGLKIKSILRKLEKVNQERVPVTLGNKLNRVCVIEQEAKAFDRSRLKKLATLLKVKEKDIVFMSFVEQKKKEDKEHPALFSPKDIGWKGVFKTVALKDIQKSDFDVLISYYQANNIVLDAVSSLVPAHFKVGLGNDTNQTHDLKLAVQVEETGVFLDELKKYLKILKII